MPDDGGPDDDCPDDGVLVGCVLLADGELVAVECGLGVGLGLGLALGAPGSGVRGADVLVAECCRAREWLTVAADVGFTRT
ncbi:MAG TPA: hypothetical protein VMU94_23355 [Streptosporangiaceae bacterium]|nr:hypothetical protein [Streptosporangiaceae bacterium]